MGDRYTLTESMERLGITRPTLNKYIRRLGIQVRFDPLDMRVKLLDEGQLAQLEDAVRRMRQREQK